jgi:hypothetical protein
MASDRHATRLGQVLVLAVAALTCPPFVTTSRHPSASINLITLRIFIAALAC